ncbi:hypothetical protein A2331_01340 [Candidatus Falkowbacteria bacterium RIFOXYB2_FULL_34_18]|uniref:DEAD/DEAH box helicase n=1 Tax=Candidatus Falkowbacteria bacterium RIFOXYD2_FULL_34_120 TaxID=1798007 RepID=A0A1F5TPJ6_9BACT|nr:MAG: hypothetical protein A2331_01340 [Candidatus Falkowbacteria bacterium RIFOXYB2_FULL_34_18]OGF29261.1 MAG: hypothetical protein A2500_05220 [Candidatus Falkowbacteria bacterium RIFOXYC12_FULL_34_55]OGF36377.1 MAG: hypothetical protein A2466_00880 [Candidatus Falkowbacteria bacterium RIFOXYC2_FULL_34_220]OGF38856.1 MAG: hypothetical protein A2515_05640 [Candidatus Falkowbacteria bacterium RIFOXYD12_FULL_34_57]OGF40875.1 MAG: hypothetical protein A2531_03865 [Candidatus Falkowbacteria bact
MTTFKELGLNSEIMKSLSDLGFLEPSPVQEKAITFILKSKKDLIALAQTGTGKTAAFGLPILNQIKTGRKDLQAIIICPTRELCIQISEDIKKLAKYSKGIITTAVYGGERIDIQIRALRKGTNIVVGTPGRVHDLIRRKILKLQNIRWLVLDEADEMLDMGFKDDLDAILEETPKTRQTLLFSATMSKSVNAIARKYMGDAEEISIGEKNIGAEKVTHEYFMVHPRDRFEALKRILDYLPGVYGILFCRTRRETGEIADKLKEANYDTEALHGDISQNMRTNIMDRFKRKQVRLLVATDVAARGIDVSDLSHVINYNLPDQNGAYIHRSGRTGRAQKSGISISIITPREVRRIGELEGTIGKKFELKKVPSGKDVCLKQIDNFLEEIEKTDIKNTNNEQYFKNFIERLKKINKEDLIKIFLTHKFNHFMDVYKNTQDLNATAKIFNTRSGEENHVSLKINFGKKEGFDIKGLFALINSDRKLKGIEIGRINLKLENSIFSVEKSRADDVVKQLQGAIFRGKKIDIKKSNETVGFHERRRENQSRGFKRKRKGFKRRSNI